MSPAAWEPTQLVSQCLKVLVCTEKYFPMMVPLPSSSPLQQCCHSSADPILLKQSLSCGALFYSQGCILAKLSGYLHTAKLFLSLELTSKDWVAVPSSCPNVSDSGVWVQWYCWYVCFSFCFSLLSSVTILFSEALRWSPRVSVPILFHISLSRGAGPMLISFFPYYFSFSLCSTQLCGEFLVPFGCIRTSTSIQQMFCANLSTYRWALLCVCGRRWVSCLTSPPSWILQIFLVSWRMPISSRNYFHYIP